MAKVIGIDKDGKRVNLSIKKMTEDPFEDLSKEYKVDKKVSGEVKQVSSLGAIVDLIAISLFPILFCFSPDPTLFAFNLLVFIPYGLLIGIISQAIAIQFAYGEFKHKSLLLYAPLYPILRIVNVLARSKSIIDYFAGSNGKWYKNKAQSI